MMAKEFRAVGPVWGAAVVGLWAASFPDSPLVYAGVALYFIAAAGMGAFSIGHEYAYGTLGYALSLPVPRRRIWLTKLAVLLPMLAALAVVAALRVHVDRSDRTFGYALFWGPALAACTVAPWLTMLTRSPLAGTVFTIGLVGGSMSLGDWIGVSRYGFTQEVDVFRVTFFCWSIGLLSTAGAVAGWRAFAHLEVTDDRGGDVQLLVSSARVAPATPVRPRHPIAALVSKELRLQQLALIVAALYVAGGVAALLLSGANPMAYNVFSLMTSLYVFVMPAVIGSLAVAEEHQFGTHDAQLLLPITSSRQWLVKTAVALGLAALYVVVLPVLLNRAFPPHIVHGFGSLRVRPSTMLMALGGASVSLYVSTIVRSGVSALVAALGAMAGLVAFVLSVMLGLVATVYESVHHVTTIHRPHRTPEPDWLWIVPMAVFICLLWRFGLTSYRYGDRPVTRVVGHALAALAFLVLYGAAVGAIMGLR